MKPQEVLEKINKYINENTYVTTEVGQHQMWAAQFLKMKGPGKFITSGGLGTMGFGLPAALGIGVNDKNKKIIVISGDGSFQMNFAELATASESTPAVSRRFAMRRAVIGSREAAFLS